MSDYSKISSFLRNGNSEGVNLSEDELLKFIWDQVKFWSEEEARENFVVYDPHEGKHQDMLEEDTKEIFMKTMGQISYWAFQQRDSYPYYDEADLADGEMKMVLGDLKMEKENWIEDNFSCDFCGIEIENDYEGGCFMDGTAFCHGDFSDDIACASCYEKGLWHKKHEEDLKTCIS